MPWHNSKVGRPLSRRENQLLGLMVAGNKPAAIAEQLGLSVKTVAIYRGRLMLKAGCKTDAQLGAWSARTESVKA